MTEDRPPSAAAYFGLGAITLATLMHQILLTRIFSVAMFYHFAFMAISIAMFGMTVGAIVVYLRPAYTRESAPRDLANASLAQAVSIVVTFIVFLQIPFIGDASLKNILLLTVTYAVVSVPFVFSGITVSIALTKFPSHVGKLYAADLVGASLGGIVLIETLELTDGPTAVLVAAAIAALGAALFGAAASSTLARRGGAAMGLLVVAALAHTSFVEKGTPWLDISEARGVKQEGNHYVRWNSFSRVHVAGNPWMKTEPLGWGLSSKTGAKDKHVRQLFMAVDVWAATVITQFSGDLREVAYLKDDVTNLAHHLRPGANVLAVGVGGGRDVLSALVFDQAHVTGVEINENVLRASMDVYGAFSGHLDRHPKVTIVNDEARSFIARSADRYDVIGISLIDTWAATAAGAFVLSENALYTVEAWRTFLGRLTPRGVLSVSRWWFPTNPGETYRCVAIARATLDALGAKDPRAHVVVAMSPISSGLPGALGNGVANVLVSPSPFDPVDLAVLERESARQGFQLITTPKATTDDVIAEILDPGTNPSALYANHPIDISPPTDDRPFFFQMLRMKDIVKPKGVSGFDPNHTNLESIRILGVLLGIAFVLTALCVFVPLVITRRTVSLGRARPLMAFFLCIGLGFMFIEISQMQRLIVFLGHPTYALTVVLFTLLVGAGMGSLLSERLARGDEEGRAKLLLAALFAVLVVFGLLTPWIIDAFVASTNAVRISAAVLLLLAIGVFLGMPFPLGMSLGASRSPSLTPWLWGINGAASVLCSVLATAVAMTWGIAVSYWMGVACYAGALGAFHFALKAPRETAAVG